MILSYVSVPMGSAQGEGYYCYCTGRQLRGQCGQVLYPNVRASTSSSSRLFPQCMWATSECTAGSGNRAVFRPWAPLTPGQPMPSVGLQGAPHSPGKTLPTYSGSHLNITTCQCPRERPWQALFPLPHTPGENPPSHSKVHTTRGCIGPGTEIVQHND